MTTKYKAEGQKNIIFEFPTSNPGKEQVVRIRKRFINKKTENDSNIGMEHVTEEIFYSGVMMPLLYPYCYPITSISMSDEISSKIIKAYEEATPHRPKRFVKTTTIDITERKGFLMEDHTKCSPFSYPSDVLCIEIKPKSGQKTSSSLIKPTHDIKRRKCTYCLRQMLKFTVGDVDRKSSYCPRDLFSRCNERIKKALNNLFQDPQNNLKIFFRGDLCFTGKLGGKHDDMNAQKISDLSPLFGEFLNCYPENSIETLQSLLTSIILESTPLFNIIKSIQDRDYYNIEVIAPFYSNIVELGLLNELKEYCGTPQKYDSIPLKTFEIQELKNLLLLNTDKLGKLLFDDSNPSNSKNHKINCYRIIKDFLLAASLKDCSIMITMVYSNIKKNDENIQLINNNWKMLSINDTDRIYFRVAIIDVDQKIPTNIPKYALLDERIITNALQVNHTPSCK